MSRARNPVIAGGLHKLTIMENWGPGFERIETDAQQLGYALPTWEDKGSVLRAKLLPHPNPQIPTGDEFTLTYAVIVNVSVNERQQWFMNRLSDDYLAKAEDIAHKFGVTDRTARRDISQLQEMDLIGFMGSFKTGRYVLLKQRTGLG